LVLMLLLGGSSLAGAAGVAAWSGARCAAGGTGSMFLALQNWVEAGTVPGRIDVSSSDASVSLPMCVYPQKLAYSGTGSVKVVLKASR
jgi:hypothetical protein